MNIKQEADSYVEMFLYEDIRIDLNTAIRIAIIHVEGLIEVHKFYKFDWTLEKLTLDDVLSELKSRI